MPTTGVFNGTNLLLKVEGATLGHTTSCTLSLSNDLPEEELQKLAHFY